MVPVSQPDPDLDSSVPGMHIWGWMSEAELTWLGEQAAQMQSVVEVGVLHGRSAYALLSACLGPVYCIDPWNDEGGHSLPSFLRSCGHFENLVVCQGYSPEAGGMVHTDVDMVFIDGDHHYDSVRADLDYWLPRTRTLICGHDFYDTDEWKVETAVRETFGDEAVLVEGTGIWAVWL